MGLTPLVDHVDGEPGSHGRLCSAVPGPMQVGLESRGSTEMFVDFGCVGFLLSLSWHGGSSSCAFAAVGWDRHLEPQTLNNLLEGVNSGLGLGREEDSPELEYEASS